jgi:hypothetical protein
MKVKVKSIILFFIFSVSFFSIMGFVTMTHNGLAVGAVADFGALHHQYTTKADAR